MKKILIFSLFCFQCVFGDQRLETYFTYVQQLGKPCGDHQKGEIEVVMNPSEILRIQEIQKNRLIQKGFSKDMAAEFSRIGIVSEDQYWVWLRDAVYFPQGIPGTYDRLLWRSELENKHSGVAILPALSCDRIVLILNYRHATRSWELELPRGGVELQETFENAALRELREETGFEASSATFLGEIATDTGVHSSVTPVFIAKISIQKESCPEYSEAIGGVLSFTKEELKAGLIQGFLEVPVNGEKKQVPLRDAFLTFALLQAEIRGLL